MAQTAGHGEKQTRKKEMAIAALLSATSIENAAKAAGIGVNTLRQWMRDEVFMGDFRQAKTEVLQQAISALQASVGDAARVLRDVAIDQDAPASSRVSAARSIIELAAKFHETEEIELRLEKLEQALALQEKERDSA